MAFTNKNIFDLINYLANKDQSGKSLKPEKFDLLLKAASYEFFKEQRKMYELTQEVTNAIKHLKVYDETLTLASGVASLSSSNTYAYGGQLYYVQTVSGTDYNRKIDIVTDSEWNRRISSVIENASIKYPIAKFVGDNIYYKPITITGIKFSYIKSPEEPNLDYYIDANDVEIFFKDRSDVQTWAAGTYNTDDVVYYSVDGHCYTCLQDGVTSTPALGADWEYNEDYTHLLVTDEEGSNGESAGTVVDTSTTDMLWRDEDKLVIANNILKKIGVNLRERDIVNYAAQEINQTPLA